MNDNCPKCGQPLRDAGCCVVPPTILVVHVSSLVWQMLQGRVVFTETRQPLTDELLDEYGF